ncbi:MAG: glycosyltransferase family 4 protein [Chloroflexi bacterium]|nr:glycosyltransferase family 4 protein [Chloroflexota bacterium]
MPGAQRRIWMIDPVGGHRGMHYYDFALCQELQKLGVDVRFFTCDETALHAPPARLAVSYPFQRIFGRSPAPLRGIRYMAALRRLARRALHDPPEIAHLHYFLLAPADLWFLKSLRRRGVRIVFTAHDVIPFHAAVHTRAVLRALYRQIDGFIVHTRHSRDELLAAFPVSSSVVRVIPHGHYLPYRDEELPDRVEARQRFNLPEDASILLFFGQIKRVKGLDVLLRALPKLVETHPRLILVIAGQVWKDDWRPYARLIEGLGLEGHVRARIEYIPDEDVAYYFRAADAVVLPYRRIYQSGVLLMAYSFERPVVASAVGGLAETVRDGETGYLVPPGDPDALAEALRKILRDGERAVEMGKAGYRLVQSQFGWDRIAERTLALYEDLLSR